MLLRFCCRAPNIVRHFMRVPVHLVCLFADTGIVRSRNLVNWTYGEGTFNNSFSTTEVCCGGMARPSLDDGKISPLNQWLTANQPGKKTGLLYVLFYFTPKIGHLPRQALDKHRANLKRPFSRRLLRAGLLASESLSLGSFRERRGRVLRRCPRLQA